MNILLAYCCVVLLFLAGLFPSDYALGAALDSEARAISLAISQEPPNLNSTVSADTVSHFVLDHIMEGLLTIDDQQQLRGGVAERWELREDGATFWLRDNAKWSNGEPVTADDFVFSWRQVVDPKNASEYAFISYPIYNAEAVNTGRLPPESLGVKALDKLTLEVKFERPCPYFLSLAAFPLLYPINQSFYDSRKGQYAVDADDLLFNGPFVMAEWVHGSSLKFKKNPAYWNQEAIWLNVIDIPYITGDANTRLNLLKDNKIALADQLVEESMIGALRQRMQLKTFLDGAVSFVEFNFRAQRITRNRHLRQAIQAVINQSDLVYRVQGSPGNSPAYTHFPSWLRGNHGRFTDEYPVPIYEPNVLKARKLLKKAKVELAITDFPPLTILVTEESSARKTAEYLQTRLRQTLGLDVRIDVQIFKQRLAKAMAGEFDLQVTGWAPDYNDPLTYADRFSSHNNNNRGRFSSKKYDQLIAVAQTSMDTAERMDAFSEMQTFLQENAIMIPLYERGSIYVQNPRLQSVMRRTVGSDPNFKFATISEEGSAP